MVADGITPSSLLAASAQSATPATSPATPLLGIAGLGPSPSTSGGLERPASSGGLPSGMLPLPLQLGSGGFGQLPTSSQSAPMIPFLPAAAAYGRLPDTLYGSESPTSSAGGSRMSLGASGRLGGSTSGTTLNVSAQPFTLGGSGASGSSGGFSPAITSASSGAGLGSLGGQLRTPTPTASPQGSGGTSSYGGPGSTSLGGSFGAASPAPPPSLLGSATLSAGRGFGGSLGASLSGSAVVSPLVPPLGTGYLPVPSRLSQQPSPALPSGLLHPRAPQQQLHATPSAASGLGLPPARSPQGSPSAAGAVQAQGLGGDSDGTPLWTLPVHCSATHVRRRPASLCLHPLNPHLCPPPADHPHNPVPQRMWPTCGPSLAPSSASAPHPHSPPALSLSRTCGASWPCCRQTKRWPTWRARGWQAGTRRPWWSCCASSTRLPPRRARCSCLSGCAACRPTARTRTCAALTRMQR